MGPQCGPVDRSNNTPFENALIPIFARNEETGKGPAHVRALARRMVELQHPGHPATHTQIEDKRRQLRRYFSGERGYSEQTRGLIAEALGVDVSVIPPPSQARAYHRKRVEELERELEDLRSRLGRRRGTR
jgi:hypothetical protein